jgi:hypothetical protein
MIIKYLFIFHTIVFDNINSVLGRLSQEAFIILPAHHGFTPTSFMNKFCF